MRRVKRDSDRVSPYGSIAAAQASVGAAATWPTTGTIFSAAEPTRHGAAHRPQPDSAQQDEQQQDSFGA